MSTYFSMFPKVEYDIHGAAVTQTTTAVNLFNKFSIANELLKEQTTVYFPYAVGDGERADTIAFNYYGDVKYTWLIFLINDIHDPMAQWPKSNQEFTDYIIQKYGSVSVTKTTIHHYDQIIHDINMVPSYLEVDLLTYSSIVDPNKKRIVYVYDWEVDQNEKFREVNLIEDVYVQDMFKEMRDRLK